MLVHGGVPLGGRGSDWVVRVIEKAQRSAAWGRGSRGMATELPTEDRRAWKGHLSETKFSE